MKIVLIGLVVLSSISSFADTDFKCVVRNDANRNNDDIVLFRVQDDGSLCLINSARKCWTGIREVKINSDITALLADGSSFSFLYNVPSDFRRAESFQGVELVYTDIRRDLLLFKGDPGVHPMGCIKL